MKAHFAVLLAVALFAYVEARNRVFAAEMPVNSLGMKMVRIEGGTFQMGGRRNETLLASDQWDERPVHEVTISRPFHIAATEVTNAQYEQFNPDHKRLRGKLGFSKTDDEAVVFVSWNETVAFCKWLSQKEGKPYRLPSDQMQTHKSPAVDGQRAWPLAVSRRDRRKRLQRFLSRATCQGKCTTPGTFPPVDWTTCVRFLENAILG